MKLNGFYGSLLLKLFLTGMVFIHIGASDHSTSDHSPALKKDGFPGVSVSYVESIIYPYATVSAVSFNESSGIEIIDLPNTDVVSEISDGDFIRFDDVEFGNGPISGIVSASSNIDAGLIEFRLESLDGPLLGTANLSNTGDLREFQDVPIEVANSISYSDGSVFVGRQTLFLVFLGSETSFSMIESFQFNPSEVEIEDLNILNCPSESILLGDQIDLELNFTPTFPSNTGVSFEVSPAISIDPISGIITANSVGEFTITAISLSDPSISDQCIITVSDPLPAVIRINSGGPTVTYGDSVFVDDQYFAGNGKEYTNNNITEILETNQDEIYKSERSTLANLQSFSYNIPVTNGDYTVNLHFAEIFFGATGGGSGGSGQRVFDVSLEGVSILSDFDLNALVDPMTAIIETFSTTVTDQSLDITFSASVNQPKISAVEVYGEGSLIIDPTDCTWNSLANSSLSKVEAQSVKVNGKLYVLAGFLAGLQITGATEIYDPSIDAWTSGAPMPIPVTHMGAVAVGSDIWILAGFEGNHPGVATDAVQIYNTISDTWTSGPPLPNPRGSGAAAYSNGKIYFFGGLLPDRVTDVGEHYVLNVNNQAAGWQSLADLPEPRNHLSAAAVNGIIYAVGGQFGHDSGVDDQKFLHAYDPQNDTWTQLADLPTDRSHFEPGTMVHNNKIIIVGGRNGGFFFDDITEYDPVTDIWSELCELPSALLAPSAKIFGDQLIVANGGEGGVCCPLDETISISVEPELVDNFRVLIFHKTNGFRHGSINAGIDMIEDFGAENDWIVEESQNSSMFNEVNLSTADVVVWLNTSGNNLLTGAEQDAFEDYIQNGGGFVGFHAATDTYRNQSWPWYNDLVGAIVQTGPNHTSNNFNATMDVVGSHPAVEHLGTEWNKDEEYYYWELNGGYIFDENIDLLQVRSTGSQSYDAPRPITWYKEYDGGRSFYTALGHNGSDYNSDEDFRIMSEQAILWAGGLINIVPEGSVPEDVADDQENYDDRFVAYPNPSKDILMIKSENEEFMEVRLFSVTHTLVKSGSGSDEVKINMSDLEKGLYILQINQEDSQRQLKVLKD